MMVFLFASPLLNPIIIIEGQFPPGVQKPQIGDDYALVYGFQLAVTGDGLSHKELGDYADFLKKKLSIVPGVARVDLWGNRDRAVYIDVTEAQLAEFGLSPESFSATLGDQNMVVDAGHVNVADRRLRLAPTGEFRSPDEIGE